LTALWTSQAVMHRRKFLQGRAIRGADVKDITWLTPKGQEVTDADWNHADARCLGVRVAGDIDEIDERGERIVGDTLLLLFNADAKPTGFRLPTDGSADRWELVVDTASPTRVASLAADETYRMESRSLAVFRLVVGVAPGPGFRT
jgi:glycogen operon protein